jgi:hypothetical protein
MALTFYLDVHIPFAVMHGLRRRGIDVLTSQDDGTREADDEQLLTRATQLHRIVVTQDDDFLVLSDEWQKSGRSFAGIVFAHQEGLSIGRALEDLELIAECCTTAEMANRVVFLPLR